MAPKAKAVAKKRIVGPAEMLVKKAELNEAREHAKRAWKATKAADAREARRRRKLNQEAASLPLSTLRKVIQGYTREAGVRDLNRHVQALARKATAKLVMEEAEAPLKVQAGELHDWLGPPRFSELTEQRLKRPGIAVGLAWTPSGGDVLLIETTLMPGKGMVRVTGNLRQVMKESVLLINA